MATNFKKIAQGQNLLSLATYLMVAAVFVRTFLYYPHILAPAFGALLFLVILLFLEPVIIRQPKIVWGIYVALQLGIMITLFLLEPDGDTFALLMLPAAMFVMRHYEQLTAWIWLGIFSIVMSILLFYGHQSYAPAMIVIYLVAYVLVASFSLTLKQNRIVQKQLIAANKQLRDYAEQVEELTAENERNRLARELHDSVTQTIFSMTLITRSARTLQERDPDQVAGKLEELQDLAQNALTEMRALITQLRPLSISTDGLYAVLGKHIKEFSQRSELNISLEIPEEDTWLVCNQEQEVFRIVQEALNNISKHAQAKQALIKFEQTPTLLTITISDDGQGFDLNEKAESSHHHFGLESMRQRATELNGTLEVKSTLGAGTQVICKIPNTKDAA